MDELLTMLEELRQAGWQVELNGYSPESDYAGWNCQLFPRDMSPGNDWPDVDAPTALEAIRRAVREARVYEATAGESLHP
jgi:hypothetical protein